MTAQELKNSIFQMAIQGKLVPQNQNDEPATVLLENVKIEREQLIKDKKIKKERYSEIYKDETNNRYYEKFDDEIIVDITEEISFDIPNTWCWTRLKNIGVLQTGTTPSTNNSSYFGKDIPFIKPGDIYYNKIDYNNEGLTLEGASRARKIESKSILMVCIGGSIGKAFYNDREVCFNQQINAVTPIIIDYKYLFYLMISGYFYSFLKANSGGTATPIINKTLWGEIMIPIAPLEEQQRIVEKIDKILPYIEQYDEKNIELEKINNSYQEELKESILQYAIQGKLVKQNSEEESAQILIDKILDEKHEMMVDKKIKKEKLSVIYKDVDGEYYEKFDDGTTNNITNEIPFDIPDNWCWTRLYNITSILGDGLHGTPDYDEHGDYYFINGNNLFNGKIILKSDTKRVNKEEYEKYKKILNDNTMFISINGTIGNIAFYDNEKVMLGKSVCYFNLLNIEFKKYLFYFFQSKYFYNYAINSATGTTIKNVSLKVMNNTLIPLPVLEEQKRIVEKIEKMYEILGNNI